MIAEIVVVTDRGDIIVRKIYRNEALKYNAVAVFARKLSDIKGGHIPPHFAEDGIHFYYIHRGSLYFLATAANDVSTIAVIEFLSRLYSMAKDMFGIVTEESLRTNFLPMFEMLGDSMDSGYVQAAGIEKLKPFILSQPVAVQTPQSAQEDVVSRIFGIDSRVMPASAARNPAVDSAVDRNALYVDIVENLVAVTNAEGRVEHLKVEGTLSAKNRLRGQPTINIAVNPDLQICKPGDVKAFGISAHISDCKFHSNVDVPRFYEKRVLKIPAPAGEFAAMTYSVDESLVSLPLHVTITVKDITGSRDKLVTIDVSLNVPAIAEAKRIQVVLPVPHCVTGVSMNAKGVSESLIFKEEEKKVVWTICNMHCAERSKAQLRLVSHSSHVIPTADIRLATVDFEISNLTLSGLRTRYIKVLENNQVLPISKFVRSLTISDSYTVKIS